MGPTGEASQGGLRRASRAGWRLGRENRWGRAGKANPLVTRRCADAPTAARTPPAGTASCSPKLTASGKRRTRSRSAGQAPIETRQLAGLSTARIRRPTWTSPIAATPRQFPWRSFPGRTGSRSPTAAAGSNWPRPSRDPATRSRPGHRQSRLAAPLRPGLVRTPSDFGLAATRAAGTARLARGGRS